MRHRWSLVTILMLVGLALPATPALAAGCQYILGFKTLHADLGLTVANCLDDQTFAANGDALQHTAHGLLVWRKADNVTAFTDGYHTWIDGPAGIELRLNNQRFSWESDAGAPGTTLLSTPVADVPALPYVTALLARTTEVAIPSEHMALELPPVTISDGGAGTLTAAIGGRFPTADGYGQLVFFWHGTTFLGWDANQESMSIRGITSPGAGAFSISYAHYAATDALCCPSQPPVTITYTWNGSRLVPDAAPPTWGKPILVTLGAF